MKKGYLGINQGDKGSVQWTLQNTAERSWKRHK